MDDECADSEPVEPSRPGGRRLTQPVEERDLGQHLGAPTFRRHDGRGEHRRRRAGARERFDQVVVFGAVRARPAAPSSRARGHRAVGEDDGGKRRPASGVFDLDAPRGAVGRLADARGRSPPTFTHTPSAPSSTSSAATRSAASPLPMPPGSNATSNGRRTVPSSSSTSMPSGPATIPKVVAGATVIESKGRSYPAAITAGSTVGSKRPPVNR